MEWEATRALRKQTLNGRGDDYADVVDVIMDGGLSAPTRPDRAPRFRARYSVALDRWDVMTATLLLEVIADARTTAQAAEVLGLSSRQIEARIRWARGEVRGARESFIVSVGAWDEMTDELLLAVTEGLGSLRSAAAAIGMSRSTLSRRLARARARAREGRA